ncbi:MAG TPA: cytochrome c family protein [Xanthobacteraceae bacterium]|nr:cytochrome c family protein [Xanthobacteraceae bacterium]
MRALLLRLGGAVAAALAALPAVAADLEHGRQLYRSCAACHTDQPGALGPTLKGVVGRQAGAREDFRYSNAMKNAGFVWDEANLRGFLENPQGKVKGNRMPFEGLRDPKDRDDLVAYLATLK